ncbi:hypothetical protein GQ54DRAFT_266722 [Martensiomyces pterosporus]|nr:hypothetical protein GQ54DRAFT_266722 [Martensiomyces pterosporus]
MALRLKIQDGSYSVCRYPATADARLLLERCIGAEFYSITRTKDEISVIQPANIAGVGGDSKPAGKIESGWRLIKVEGPLDFGLVGIIHKISERLAGAGVPLFVTSTFDTDYVMVKAERLADAAEALNRDGISIEHAK